MKTPNLFSYATSELSQDAFICWLLEWASPEFRNVDSDLHACATEFVNSLFSIHKKEYPTKINKVEVRKQDKNIDVLCIINDEYPILIEDKTGTKHHSGQLSRYLNTIKDRSYSEEKIFPIYFKTEDQASYKDVIKNGYMPYLRSDFLKILISYQGENSILIDYRDHLRSIENCVKSFKSLPIDQWHWHSWIGFYQEIHDKLDGHWDYVANPSGGFLGYWWCFQGDDNCAQYLQLEQGKFCFKIWVKHKNERSCLRSKWHNLIKDKSNELNFSLTKPERFGSGEYMTVCIFDGEYRVANEGILDLEKTIQRLRLAEEILYSVKEST